MFDELHSSNITHNLAEMARAAGLYEALWCPGENGMTHAHQLIEPLKLGLEKLLADPERYKQFDSPNGWGLYKHFVPFVSAYLVACQKHPSGRVHTDV